MVQHRNASQEKDEESLCYEDQYLERDGNNPNTNCVFVSAFIYSIEVLVHWYEKFVMDTYLKKWLIDSR